jgi:hypothetical protein
MTNDETYRLTAADAAIVKGLLARGEKQQDVMAYFIVMHGSLNQGRIADIATGKKFPDVEAANDLPLPLASIFERWRSLLRLAIELADAIKGAKS